MCILVQVVEMCDLSHLKYSKINKANDGVVFLQVLGVSCSSVCHDLYSIYHVLLSHYRLVLIVMNCPLEMKLYIIRKYIRIGTKSVV